MNGGKDLNKALNFLKTHYRFVLNVGFLIVIFVILIVPLTKINKQVKSTIENRNLAPRTKLVKSGKINTKFGTEFESWLSDRFRGRAKLLSFYNNINTELLGRIENKRAFQGKNGWLFYKAENSIPNYQNKILFTDTQLNNINNNLLKRNNLLKENGIKFYVLIAPDKNRIYGEYYHPGINKVSTQGRAEQLFSYLSSSNLNVVYPLTEMLSAKSQGAVYYRLDTHWNNYGAFVGYSNLMKAIKKDYPTLTVLELNDFEIKTRPEKGGDLLNMLNVPLQKLKMKDNSILVLDKKNPYNYKYLKNKSTKGVHTKNAKPLNKLRVFVLRDSFTTAMEPFVSETFAEANYVWTHNFNNQYKEILKFKPDIVIHEMVERYAHVLLNDNPPLKGGKQ